MAKIKVFRDPVHVNITFNPNSDAEALVLRLLDTPQVQRLRHVRQLALANTVYHGAEHSRFSHTLGVVHLAKRMYELAQGASDMRDEREYAVVLTAALLHDIGHPPFSHAVERTLGVKHEKLTLKLLQEDTEVHSILRDAYGDTFIKAVSNHIDGKSDVPTTQIISSQLDADRMDYVLRDAYHAGVPNARYDLERILQTVELDNRGLLFGERGLYAIEAYFIARYHLYLQLYFHKTNRAAEAVLRGVLQRAKYLYTQGIDLGAVDSTVLQMFGDKAIDAAVQLSDHDLWSTFRVWLSHDDDILRELSDRLLHRRYFKSIELSTDSHTVNEYHVEYKPKLDALAERHGFDPSYYIIVDMPKDTPYKVANVSPSGEVTTSVRVWNRGNVERLEQMSKLIAALQQQATSKFRVCFPEEIRNEVYQIIPQ